MCITQNVIIKLVKENNVKKMQKILAKHRSLFDDVWEGLNLLHISISNSNLAVIEFLISEVGISINSLTHTGKSALILSIESNNLEIAKYLISSGADCDTCFPLHVAAAIGNVDMMKLFPGVNVKDANGNAPIHLAIRYLKISSFNELIHRKDIDLMIEDNGGNMAIHLLASIKAMFFMEQILSLVDEADQTKMILHRNKHAMNVIDIVLSNDDQISLNKLKKYTPIELKDFGSLTCTICQDLLYMPVRLKCGHIFCSQCIEEFGRCPYRCLIDKGVRMLDASTMLEINETVSGVDFKARESTMHLSKIIRMIYRANIGPIKFIPMYIILSPNIRVELRYHERYLYLSSIIGPILPNTNLVNLARWNYISGDHHIVCVNSHIILRASIAVTLASTSCLKEMLRVFKINYCKIYTSIERSVDIKDAVHPSPLHISIKRGNVKKMSIIVGNERNFKYNENGDILDVFRVAYVCTILNNILALEILIFISILPGCRASLHGKDVIVIYTMRVGNSFGVDMIDTIAVIENECARLKDRIC